MINKPILDRSSAQTTEAGEIAKFYGYQPIISLKLDKQDFEMVKDFDEPNHSAEKLALLRMYFEERMMAMPQPCMFYCERPFHGSKEKKKSSKLECSVVSLGSSKSVCECLSIQAGITILNKIGYKDLEVHINSEGDKDSMNEFQKKLSLFIKKNFNSFPTELQQATKKNLFAILQESKKEWGQWQAECPKSIEFLSESSRLHFKEVLEFLEIMEIPYVIDHYLVGDSNIGSETIFSIKNLADSPLDSKKWLAFGCRFNRLAKKIGCKKDLPANILNISAKLKKPLKKIKIKKSKSQFYLVQFGIEAKLRSFLILKELHKAGVSVSHSIAKDKLSSQIGIAETSEAEYIILIGQKEALENSVIIRHNITRAQEIVPIPALATRVKELVK